MAEKQKDSTSEIKREFERQKNKFQEKIGEFKEQQKQKDRDYKNLKNKLVNKRKNVFYFIYIFLYISYIMPIIKIFNQNEMTIFVEFLEFWMSCFLKNKSAFKLFYFFRGRTLYR